MKDKDVGETASQRRRWAKMYIRRRRCKRPTRRFPDVDTALDERRYKTVHDGGEVRKGVDRSFVQSAPKELACLLGGLELGMLIIR